MDQLWFSISTKIGSKSSCIYYNFISVQVFPEYEVLIIWYKHDTHRVGIILFVIDFTHARTAITIWCLFWKKIIWNFAL